MSLDYKKIQKYISVQRLQNYELVCHGNIRRALKLYQTNLRLSQAFYPLLSLFEVVLRNALNEELTSHISDPEWLRNQVKGFMVDPSLTFIDPVSGKPKHNHYLKNCVTNSVKKLIPPVTQGKIIADLTFGFWTALFDPTHYKILTGRPIKIFNSLPPGTNRNTIHKKLIRIRDFRNRVYHNEPVIFHNDLAKGITFNLLQLETIYKDINDFFEWLNLDFNKWTQRINNINFEISRAECMMKYYPLKIYYFKRIIIWFKYYSNYLNNR